MMSQTNDPKGKQAKQTRGGCMRLFLYIPIAVVGFLIGMPVALSFLPSNASAGVFFAVIVLVSLCVIPLPWVVVWLFTRLYEGDYAKISQQMVHLLLLGNLVGGLILFLAFGWDSPVGISLMGGCLVLILAIWFFDQIPPLLFVPMIIIVGYAFLPMLINEMIPESYKDSSQSFYNRFILTGVFGVVKTKCLTLLLITTFFACVYFPRKMQLSRYFLPQYAISRPRKRKSGFTLIELLIVIAGIGIIMGGLSFGLVRVMKGAQTVEAKTRITQILSSEMDAIQESGPTLRMSEELKAFPIPLSRFESGLDLSGGYFVHTSDMEGVMRIEVRLKETLLGGKERHYRLIGFASSRGGINHEE